MTTKSKVYDKFSCFLGCSSVKFNIVVTATFLYLTLVLWDNDYQFAKRKKQRKRLNELPMQSLLFGFKILSGCMF